MEVVLSEFSPDIVCLSELALREEEVLHFCLPGYQLVSYYCRNLTNRGGGTGIFILNCYLPQIKTINLTDFCRDKLFEACAIQFILENVKYVVVCVYRTPSMGKFEVDCFVDSLISFLESPGFDKCSLIILGDTNIDMMKKDYRRLKIEECLAIFNLHSVVNTPTRSDAAIDNIFTNIQPERYTSKVHRTELSDHSGVSITFKLKHQPLQIHTYVRKFTENSVNLFLYYLKEVNWKDVINNTNINLSYNTFENIITTFYNLCFPFKKLSAKGKPRQKLSTEAAKLKTEIISLIELRNKFSNTPLLNIKIDSLKAKYNETLKKDKRNKINSFLQHSDNITKSAWEVVNKECRADRLIKQEVRVNDDSGLPLNSHQACDKFAQYFESVPLLILDKLQHYRSNISNCFIDKVNENSIFLFPATEEEIVAYLRKLKCKKSAGFDGISNTLLKQIGPFILKPLVHLVNLMMEKGVFPDRLKIAKVIPVYKKGDRDELKNYRPVSILPSVSKIFEYVILHRVTSFLETFHILSSNQFGFLRGKSTVDAIVSFVEQVLDELEDNKFCLATFLDLSSAFDCVDRQLLLNKMEKYGFRGVPLNLISSYLNNRWQFVCLPRGTRDQINSVNIPFPGVSPDSFCSSLKPVPFGVPQGSVLGPLLFLIYINSLVKDNFMYADDTTCLIADMSLQNLEISANCQVNELVQNLAAHSLMVNATKTASLMFNSRSSFLIEPVVTIGDSNIENCRVVRFLGMQVDSDLRWSSHVDMVCDKVCSGLFVLRNISKMCNQHISMSVYYALVQSHITYGIVLWGSCSLYNMNRLLKLQKRAIRYICALPHDAHCRDYFRRLKILTVPSLYVLEVCLHIKKRAALLRRLGSDHSYNTRCRQNFSLPQHRTCRYETKPSYQGMKLFEKLPDHIRDEISTTSFKSKLKLHLIEKCIYKLSEL